MKRKQRPTAKVRLDGDPILKAICEPISPDEDIRHITRDMIYILANSKHGVGLSANQAGYAKRIIVVKEIPGAVYTVMINPEFSDALPNILPSKQVEGCLSYPGKYVEVARHRKINVSYETENNELVTGTLSYMSARIYQHEVDHLNGICIVGEKG